MEILGFLSKLSNSTRLFILSALTFVILGSYSAFAQDAVTADHAVFVANNIWMMVATFLVFIMHLGFASLEAGLTRAKNTVNILFKNTFIVSMWPRIFIYFLFLRGGGNVII